MPRIKKLKKQTHIFFWKMGVCYLQLFYQKDGSVSNRDLFLLDYFMYKRSYKNNLKQCKISYNLIKFYSILEIRVLTESGDTFLCFWTLSM